MQSKATTAEASMVELPPDRKKSMEELRKVIKKNLPKGFQEGMGYGMLGYCVPHSQYPAGYHCNPEQPLQFMSLATLKNFIAIYHMGIYGDPKLLKWFTDEYAKAGVGKLDMGKSCVRFKNMEKIPYKLIGELASKITPAEWIACYEKILKK